jgi:hypothetical protein
MKQRLHIQTHVHTSLRVKLDKNDVRNMAYIYRDI